jgi:hypothetical protein
MKKLLFLVAIMLPVLAFASMLDPLYDFDYARAGVKGLYVAGGPDINMDSALYDKDGKKIDVPDGFKYSSMDIWVPIKLGYSFNEKYSAGVVVPIASLSHKSSATGVTEVTEANTGLGNPWIWGKGVYTTGSGFMIGPRLGIKVPALAYTYEEQGKDAFDNRTDAAYETKAITGDKSLAIDVAAVFAARPESNSFRLDGQLALRYSMEGKYTYDVENVTATGSEIVSEELAVTPGMMLDFRAMPGMAFGGNKNFEAYLWLEYAMMLTDTKSTFSQAGVAGPETTSKGGSIFSAGIKADYAFDPNNNLELKFLYDVMAAGPENTTTIGGTDVTSSGTAAAGMSFGLGYFGYIPM